MERDASQKQNKEQFTHFYAWLDKHQRSPQAKPSQSSRRPKSASRHPIRSPQASAHGARNHRLVPQFVNIQDLQLRGKATSQRAQSAAVTGRPPATAPLHCSDGSSTVYDATTPLSNGFRPVSPPLTVNLKRPASAAPALVLTACRLQPVQAPCTPDGASLTASNQTTTGLTDPTSAPSQQQQQQQQQVQAAAIPRRPLSAISCRSEQRFLSSAGRQQVAAAQGGQIHDFRRPTAPHSANIQQNASLVQASQPAVPTWLRGCSTQGIGSALPHHTSALSVASHHMFPAAANTGSSSSTSYGASSLYSRPSSALHHAPSTPSSSLSLGCRWPGSHSAAAAHAKQLGAAAVTSCMNKTTPPATSSSTDSPWVVFGCDAPVAWQQASTLDAQCFMLQQQQQEGDDEDDEEEVVVAPHAVACGSNADDQVLQDPARSGGCQLDHSTHDVYTDQQQQQQPPLPQHQQQQQQLSCHHQAALNLFKQLPLHGAAAAASVTREWLQQVAQGLILELQRVGAPRSLCCPALPRSMPKTTSHQQTAGVKPRPSRGTAAAAHSSTAAEPQERCDGAASAACWSAVTQVGPELQIWQQLLAELCRQVHLECCERGGLLQSAVGRQQELLHQALTSCDTLYKALLGASAAQQKQHEDMLIAQQEAQALQQDCTRLRGLLDAKQAKLMTTIVELEQQQERMRRGRFHLINEQVQEARLEIERRVLKDVEVKLLSARAAAAEAAAAQQEVLLKAVEQVAGQEVVKVVQKELNKHALLAASAQQSSTLLLHKQQQDEMPVAVMPAGPRMTDEAAAAQGGT